MEGANPPSPNRTSFSRMEKKSGQFPLFLDLIQIEVIKNSILLGGGGGVKLILRKSNFHLNSS